jgi:hypothetical protein
VRNREQVTSDTLASIYDSSEHQQFCNKWHVSGEMGDYPIWRQLPAKLKELIDDGYYLRFIDEIENQFGLTKTSQVVDAADERYDQPFDDSVQAGESKQINIKKTESLMQSGKELEIWTLNNLRILFADYFYSLSDLMLLERYEPVIHRTILPLIHNVIDPAYVLSGNKTIDEIDIAMLIKDLKSDVADILAKRASLKTASMYQSAVALTFNQTQPRGCSPCSETQPDTSDSIGTKTGPSILR